MAAPVGATQGYGGNTPCVEVRGADGALIALDAGMGLYWLGRSLLAGPHGRGKGELTLLLSHTHWDHIQGFPFFVPAFIPGNRMAVWGGGVDHLEPILEGQMNPTYSPLVSLSNLGAQVEFGELGTHPTMTVGGVTITHLTYPSGPHQIVGYRLEEGGRSLCYLPEVEHPSGEPTPALVEFARGADILVHEAYYTTEELAQGGLSLAGRSGPPAGGHTSFREATEFGLAAGVGKMYYFYHHPDHDDGTIEAAVAAERARLRVRGAELDVEAAREGVEFEV